MEESKKLVVKDAHDLDKRIPQELLRKFGDKWYIEKAGLEFKANLLFGGGTYGVTTEIILSLNDAGEAKPPYTYVLAKATFTTKDGICFTNYGEASKANVTNPQMHKYMLHLAITRAECRVLRMATACGYTSVEEMDINGKKDIPVDEHDNEKPTEAQLKTIMQYCTDNNLEMPTTQKEAKELIAKMVEVKHEKIS